MYRGEKFNSITHLVGAVLALVGFGALLTISIQSRDPRLIVSFTVFGITLVLLYTMSTLYHSFQPQQLKKIFQKLDHVSIYLLIAGTYTPYMLVTLFDDGGLTMLTIIWVFAAFGLALDLVLKKNIKWLQITIYIVMGWACAIRYPSLQESLPSAGVIWLTMGGISYTVGVIFYILDKSNVMLHAHGVWHLFVLTGSACHFFSIVAYVR